MGIDWTKPLEAVHTDGRVVPVELDPEYDAPNNSGHYTLAEEPSPESWYVFTADGRSWIDEEHAWTIRNASVPKFDTSTLGPIRLSLSDNAIHATLMREALRHIVTNPECCETLPIHDRQAAWDLTIRGSDETLAILYRAIRK